MHFFSHCARKLRVGQAGEQEGGGVEEGGEVLRDVRTNRMS